MPRSLTFSELLSVFLRDVLAVFFGLLPYGLVMALIVLRAEIFQKKSAASGAFK